MHTISRGVGGEISSKMRPQKVWNLVAQVRDTHFTVVPYVVMSTKMLQNRNISQVLSLLFFKGRSAFYVLIYHSRLSKPPSFVIQWNADMHFFCLNPHLTGSPAGRCYWQLSLRKYTRWNPDLFEDSESFAMDFSRAIFHTLPFDKGRKLIEIICFKI